MKHASALLRDAYGTEAMRAVWSESAMVGKWLDVEAAIAGAQKELGILDPEVADAIIDCCRVERVPPSLIARHKERVGHLMVATLHAFAEVCGPAGEMLHLGATTQDVVDTGIALQLREGVQLIRASLDRAHESLCTLAERHKHTVMMGRTHGQHATPVTLETQHASSTMPDKRNPNLREWQDALAKLLRANASAIGQVTMQHERDATWMGVEMAVVPESFLLAAAALRHAENKP